VYDVLQKLAYGAVNVGNTLDLGLNDSVAKAMGTGSQRSPFSAAVEPSAGIPLTDFNAPNPQVQSGAKQNTSSNAVQNVTLDGESSDSSDLGFELDGQNVAKSDLGGNDAADMFGMAKIEKSGCSAFQTMLTKQSRR